MTDQADIYDSEDATILPLIHHNHRYREIIQELWGLGFTVVPRSLNERAFDLADGLAPPGMAYQWCANQKPDGWSAVPASRHPGLFAPYGYAGDIEVNGCWLMERPQTEVDAFHATAHAKARQNVADWLDRTGAMGFTGGVTVLQEGGGGRSADVREIGTTTIENAIIIPRELSPHIREIFAERDRLWGASDEWWGKPARPEYQEYRQLSERHSDWTRGQLMNAVLTPIAIENIRTKLATEGAQHEQRTDDGQPTAGDARQGSDGDDAPSGAVDTSPPGTASESTG